MRTSHFNDEGNAGSESNSLAREFKFADEDRSKPVTEKVAKILASSPIVLFMKGNASMPQCGFSANSVGILKSLGEPFTTFNILTDPEVRQGLKEISNWPTYPQIYVDKTLIGGNDILTEMHESGDLQQMIKARAK